MTTSTNGDHPTLEDAKALLERDGRHAVLLHIAKGKKGPEWKGWAKITHADPWNVTFADANEFISEQKRAR